MFDKLELRSTYSTYENDIASEFYTPVLSNSIAYDRATAYFSAKALANYAQGLELFAKNGHKYRLIISTEVSEQDYNEIKNGYALRSELRNIILRKLDEEISLHDKFNLSNLAYLIATEIIDIKMAFTRDGIFHDKFGIMKDAVNNIICFRGSNNETDAAFKANYESFDITCSWYASEFDFAKITKSIETFDNLWNNNANDILVVNIDNIIKDRILSYNKGQLFFEPALLAENCLILDYSEGLELHIKLDIARIINSAMYKLKLKKYISKINYSDNKILFKSTLTYTAYKKIISVIKMDTQNKNYDFFVSDRLNRYISQKELYIQERANVGIAIKQRHDAVMQKFNEYKTIVNSNMNRELREQQMWDSFFMYTMKKSSNFSVPGSGKTSSVLGVYAYLSSKKNVDKIVMIGPKNSFSSWIDEFNMCFKEKKYLNLFNIQEYTSVEEKRKAVLYNTANNNLLLFNYESLRSIVDEVCEIIDDRTLLVFDEVHKIKAIQGQRAEDSLLVSKSAFFTITMTGTPIPNSYADIRNILDILYHDEYDDFFGFSETQLKNPTQVDVQEINSKLQPFFCRTTKEQLSVPSANNDIMLDVLSTDAENQIFNILYMKYRKNKLALIIRLLQLESNPQMLLKAIDNGGEDFSDILYTQGSIEDIEYKDYSSDIISLINSIPQTAKFTTCIQQAKELFLADKPIIIWCIFVDSIISIQRELRKQGMRVGVVFGNVDNETRNIVLNQFKTGEIDVLITNPHTLAESISLHSICHDAIYFEYSYNLVHLLQSKDRIHRLGLKENQYTQYYFMQNYFTTFDDMKYSLDNRIYERLMEKEFLMLEAIENNQLEPVALYQDDVEKVFSDLRF